MVRWSLVLFCVFGLFVTCSEAGPLRGGGCPGGVCPTRQPVAVKAAEKVVIEVPVEAVVVAPKAAEVKAKAFADRLAAGKVTSKDFSKIEKEVPAKTIRKVLEQRWDIASCGMACRSHGSKLYDVYDDGTVEPAKEQPDEASQEGASNGRGNRFRLFRGRR